MRLHFQRTPWDLFIGLAYAVLVAGVLLGSGGGNWIAILLVLFVPGYMIVSALFPGKRDLDGIGRVGLSVGLTVATLAALGLILNLTPAGIRFGPMAASVAVVTVLVGLVAVWRRVRLPSERRLSVTLNLSRWPPPGARRLDLAVDLAILIGIVATMLILANALVTSRPGEPFTEFYLLGPGGLPSGYPTRLNVSEPGTVVFAVANREFTQTNYTVRIDLVGVALVYNATTGRNETVELNRTTQAWFNRTVTHGEIWTEPYPFAIGSAGLWKIDFLLFRGADLSRIYRHVFLIVDVQGP